MTKKWNRKTYWAITHIPSASIMGLVTSGLEFTLFDRREDIQWVLNDCVLDYRQFVKECPDYYSNNLLEILHPDVSCLEFDVIQVTIENTCQKYSAGIFPGVSVNEQDYYLAFQDVKQSIY